MEATEAPSVHRATELVCQFYQQFIYKAFTPKYLSRICTLYLRRSLCCWHLRDVAFTSVPSVTPCAYHIRLLVYHSIFRKNHIFCFNYILQLLLFGKNKLKVLYLFIHRCCSRFTYPGAWFLVLNCKHYKMRLY